MKAISIRQPYAWLIINGYKNIEFRTWTTHYRGPLAIHVSCTITPRERAIHDQVRKLFHVPALEALPTGKVIGTVDLIDCGMVSMLWPLVHGSVNHVTCWPEATCYWLLSDPVPLNGPMCKGRQTLFEVKL